MQLPPRGIVVKRDDGEGHVIWVPLRSATPGKVKIVFAAGWFGLVAYLVVRGWAHVGTVALVGTIAFCSAISWWLVVLLFNGTRVEVRRSGVKCSYGPIPWFRRRLKAQPLSSRSRFVAEKQPPAPKWLMFLAVFPLLTTGVFALIAYVVLTIRWREPIWRVMAQDEHGARVCVADWLGTRPQADRLAAELTRLFGVQSYR